MTTSARHTAIVLAGALGLLAGCASNGEVGVVTVRRPPSDAEPRVSQASFAPSEPGARPAVRDSWYAPHLRRSDPCWNPFLVVESADGDTAQIYLDGRCG